jgi:hypothetical protein
MRLLFAFCVGVAAVLAWQSSYGDTARGMIVSSYPQLGWLVAAQSAVAQTPATTISSDPEELTAVTRTLASMRQRVEQFATTQDQSVRDISNKLEVAKQEILDKISVPSSAASPAPPRKPAQAPQIAPSR